MKVFIPINEDTLPALRADDRLVPYVPGVALWAQVTVVTETQGIETAPTGARGEDRPQGCGTLPGSNSNSSSSPR